MPKGLRHSLRHTRTDAAFTKCKITKYFWKHLWFFTFNNQSFAHREVKEIKEVREVKCKRTVSASGARHCTPGTDLYYICISKRPRMRFHAGNRQRQSNYAKQDVQTQESDYHSVAKLQTQLCNNHKAFSAHKRRFYAENKTYLQCKQAFVGAQDRLHWLG